MDIPVWLLVIGAPILGIHAFFFWRAWRELARLILATCVIAWRLLREWQRRDTLPRARRNFAHRKMDPVEFLGALLRALLVVSAVVFVEGSVAHGSIFTAAASVVLAMIWWGSAKLIYVTAAASVRLILGN